MSGSRNLACAHLAALMLLGAHAAPCWPAQRSPGAPARPRARTLILALDGVPYRAVERARELGAFHSWGEPSRLISTFPSLTNIAFTAILQPFGARPAGGYEVQYYDLARNEVVGGTPIGYADRLYDWRFVFDVTGRTFLSKMAAYTVPERNSWTKYEETEELLLESERETILAHLGATDALIHLRGDPAILRFLLELDRRLAALRAAHLRLRGGPLRVVLLSDHGNSDSKVRYAPGIHQTLEASGLRVVDHLGEPQDVVAPTFGLVNYGALYTGTGDAATAAEALAGHEAVDLAAWLIGEERLRVISAGGSAEILWRQRASGLEIAYLPDQGDPLRLEEIRTRLVREGVLDRTGFAGEEGWFRATASSDYPDGPRRLIASLAGPWVKNRATVIFSIKPGYAWGWRVGHWSSQLAGGKLEGTHGGLDRVSSLGFLMTSDARYQLPEVLRAHEALLGFAPDGTEVATAWASDSPPTCH